MFCAGNCMMEKEIEASGSVWVARRKITRALIPFVENGLQDIYGVNWVLKENQRRAGYNPPIKQLNTDGPVAWSFSDLLRTIAVAAHWNSYFMAKFESGKRMAGVEPAEINKNLWELANLRNDLGHDEERDLAFSSQQRDRFFELSIRILRGAGTPQAQDVLQQIEPFARHAPVAQPAEEERTHQLVSDAINKLAEEFESRFSHLFQSISLGVKKQEEISEASPLIAENDKSDYIVNYIIAETTAAALSDAGGYLTRQRFFHRERLARAKWDWLMMFLWHPGHTSSEGITSLINIMMGFSVSDFCEFKNCGA